jgi:alkylhydroperoxidase/carboxymuconolactone decarboxylase family protein YurZ
MSRIPTITIEAADVAIRPALSEIQRRSLTPGRLLNIHAQMACAPAVFAVYASMRQALDEFSTLDFKTRSAIMLVSSVANSARYPIAIQVRLALRAGWTSAEIDAMCADAYRSDSKLAALLQVVRQTVSHIGRVDDAIWNSAVAAGWATEELCEAFANVALATMVDAFARFAEPELDVPERDESLETTADAAD